MDYRHKKTLKLVQRHIPQLSKVLDLGDRSELSEIMNDLGYRINHTTILGDLDYLTFGIQDSTITHVTAFEVLEHLVNPFTILYNFPRGTKLLATVPLRLWFMKPCWPKDKTKLPYNGHYHEFLEREFDFLLEKAGYRITYKEKWRGQERVTGIRPLLRLFYKRYYAVVAIKQ